MEEKAVSGKGDFYYGGYYPEVLIKLIQLLRPCCPGSPGHCALAASAIIKEKISKVTWALKKSAQTEVSHTKVDREHVL
jgi:hypothetical protein